MAISNWVRDNAVQNVGDRGKNQRGQGMMEDAIAAMMGPGKPKPPTEEAAHAQQAEVEARPSTEASPPPPAASPPPSAASPPPPAAAAASPPNEGASSETVAASPARAPAAAAEAVSSPRRSVRNAGSGEAAAK